MNDQQHLVVGGGLAGLTAAATLARAGRRVTVLEGAEHPGGRARSRRRDGFHVNLGPHALYRRGGGLAVLRSLGVRPRGRMPRLHRAGSYRGGEVVGAWSEMWRNVDRRVAVLRAATGRARSAAADLAGRPAATWIDEVAGDDADRATLESLIRLTTYSADTTLLDAGAATRQLRIGARGVLYLHGGWGSLVDGLVDAIRSAGGEIRTGLPVTAVDHDDAVRGVELADGTTLRADGVVVAVNDPRKVPSLLSIDASSTIAAAVDDTVPVRMAHLDVCLRPLPSPRHPNVLGLDEPVYLTVASDVADVAPDDAAVVNVGRYLRPGEESGDHRAALEALLDAAQPGWRDHVVDIRYVPRSIVGGDHARWATRGMSGRPAVDVAGVSGLAIAGDWVGPDGMLADASILSGAAAAGSLLDSARASRRAVLA